MPTLCCVSASQEADKTSQLWHYFLPRLTLCPVADSRDGALRLILWPYLLLQGKPVSTPPTILLYGHDEQLLMTRARILVGAGFRASVTCEVKQIPQLVRELQADIIVLCHGLSCTERVVAAMVAKNHRAEVRTLLMMADGSMGECDYELSEVADEMFNLSLEPERLVEKVRSMLEDRLQSGLRISPWKGLSRLAPTN
jgi:hypothetical protein